MAENNLTKSDKAEFLEAYGVEVDNLNLESFEALHKKIRAKFHPDQFEHMDNPVVKEMAEKQFKKNEALAIKVREYLLLENKDEELTSAMKDSEGDKHAYEEMKIEVLARNDDLRFWLFGRHYRWIERGDRYRIPGTNAYVISQSSGNRRMAGFVHTIKMWLTFGENDPLDVIVVWLYSRIAGNADGLIIEGKRIPVELKAMWEIIGSRSRLELGA